MGILNITPDSFSDGGRYLDRESAVRRGFEMVEEGADFIDIGGESTRPGSRPVRLEEELERTLPVIERLAKSITVPISIDTYKSEVAERALDAGAAIINDITGLHADPRIAEIASRGNASLVLMHIKGVPQTMQEHPVYENLIEEICTYLDEGTLQAKLKGVHQIIIDPGIGFGKTPEHNLQVLRDLRSFQRFGYPVLVGPSRKSFIGKVLDLPVEKRISGTAAAVAVAVVNGANIVRVHDVKEMKQVVRIVDAIVRTS